MSGRWGAARAGPHFGRRGAMPALLAAALAFAVFAAVHDRALAQLNVQSPQTQPPQAQPQPPPKKEGFLDALGRWWDQFTAATRDATDALMKLPSTRIVEGRERCALAPNGSPDCGPAAETICKAKGFTSGKSANIESARKCPARALLTRNEQDCVNETIVTRAACQ